MRISTRATKHFLAPTGAHSTASDFCSPVARRPGTAIRKKHLTVDAHAAADPHPHPWAGVARLDSMDSIHSTELYPLPAASQWFPTAPAERPPLVHTHSAEVGASELLGLLHSDDAQAQAVN